MLAPIDQYTKKRMQGLLAHSEVFDNFLQTKFPNLKRVRSFSPNRKQKVTIFVMQYGLEGGESMIPALDSLFAVASQSERFHLYPSY